MNSNGYVKFYSLANDFTLMPIMKMFFATDKGFAGADLNQIRVNTTLSKSDRFRKHMPGTNESATH